MSFAGAVFQSPWHSVEPWARCNRGGVVRNHLFSLSLWSMLPLTPNRKLVTLVTHVVPGGRATVGFFAPSLGKVVVGLGKAKVLRR